MVRLGNLDVVVLAERGGDLADDLQQQVHADGHIRRLNDCDARGGIRHLSQLRFRQARRAYDHRNLALPADLQPVHRPFRHGKVDKHLRDLRKLLRYLYAEGSRAGQLAHIAPDGVVARRFQSADDIKLLRTNRQGRYPPTHPTRRTGYRYLCH